MRCLHGSSMALMVCAVILLAVTTASDIAASEIRPVAPGIELSGIDATLKPEEAPESAEQFTFQAEVNRLMDIIINSLYSNKEIFLRELISNASDALDKVRFLALTRAGNGESAKLDADKLEVRVRADKEASILEIADTGVGMTREELIKNLGTIAKSGTRSFLDKVGAAAKETSSGSDQGGASNLIGQFGVGFYSAYLVADKVRVESRVEGGKVHVWESKAGESFVIFEGDSDDFDTHGTRITLFMKDTSAEFLDESTLKQLIQRYSQFINFPIYLRTSKQVSVPVDEEVDAERGEKDVSEDRATSSETDSDGSDEETNKESLSNDDDEIKVEDEKEEDAKDTEEKPKTRMETQFTWSLMNENKPIWTRDPSEVTDDEYQTFYDGISKLPGKPMARTHFRGEGDVEFRSILYIPDRPPVGMYTGTMEYEKDAIRLYIRRVLVSDKFEESLLPRYLGFLVGIVDSDDLPINVSREMLQKSKALDAVKRKLSRKALEMIKNLAKEDEEAVAAGKEAKDSRDNEVDDNEKEKKDSEKVERPYVKFWQEYGTSMKLGVIEDHSNRNRLAKLLRFRTSNSDMGDPNDLFSLDDYMERMKDDQNSIYYHSGETVDEIKESPFLEKLLAKNYEVLYLTEPMDEHMVSHLMEYEGNKIVSVTKENFKFGDKDQKEEKEKRDALKKKFKPLTKFLKQRLSSKVSKVKLSTRLSSTPCVLSSEQHGYSARMEIIMKAQAFADPKQFSHMISPTKIMELNPHHPMVKRMLELAEEAAAKEGDEATKAEKKIEDLGHLVYDTALVSSGYLMPDNAEYGKRMYRWLAMSFGVDPEAPIVEEIPEAEDETDDGEEQEEFDMDDFDVDSLSGASQFGRDEGVGDDVVEPGASENGDEAHDEL